MFDRMTAEPRPEFAPENHPPVEVMLLMISGFWLSRAIYAAAKLGLADLVKDGPQSAEELARRTKTSPAALFRLLRALSGFGILAEDSKGRFLTTPLGSTLESDSPYSLRAFAVSELGEDHYTAWGEFLYSLQTGRSGFQKAFGMSVWDFYRLHPENGRMFTESMKTLTSLVDSAVLSACDFSNASVLVDVGGGHARLISSVLAAYPRLRAILLDRPEVLEEARHELAEQGLEERCTLVAGDFFAGIPEGGDTCMLKWVIHDWDDESAVRILSNCWKAMKSGGRLVLVESVVPEKNVPCVSKLVDLDMLIMTDGRERTGSEFRELVEQAGFSFVGITHTESYVSIIEARKP